MCICIFLAISNPCVYLSTFMCVVCASVSVVRLIFPFRTHTHTHTYIGTYPLSISFTLLINQRHTYVRMLRWFPSLEIPQTVLFLSVFSAHCSWLCGSKYPNSSRFKSVPLNTHTHICIQLCMYVCVWRFPIIHIYVYT